MSSELDAAHLEKGYTRIANRLLEAILAAPFSSCQLRSIMALVRMTYGWNRKDVEVSGRELARRAGLQYTGRFRAAIGEMVKEGVFLMSSEGQSKPNLYRIQKTYGKWGRFASARDDLARRWDRDHEGVARNSSPRRGAAKQACPETGLPPTGQDGCPAGGIPSTANPATDNGLGGGKDIKKPLRGDSAKKKAGGRPNWVSDFGNDWIAIKKGTAPFAKIGAQLKGLFEEPLNLAPDDVQPRWQAFLRSEKSKYGCAYFAEHYGDFADSAATSREEQLRKRGIIPHG